MHVVATAGHVDHGKSTLVRALTGQEPDRLSEERRRGLSIQLGYCWTESPTQGEIAFVDVPGHERFLATTLSGLGPVPVVLFVVAADDPWMPQSEEHLAALDALGVRHGVLVVTRSDLTDPGPALQRARTELARTSLADAPAVTVSGRTGEGVDALRSALDGVLATVPTPDGAAPVRLWADRRFVVPGAGTVVTGTLPAGTVATGDRLDPGRGATVRVRGIESLERRRESVCGTARVALDLAGDLPDAWGTAAVLATPDAWEWTDVVDVRLRRPAERTRTRLPERPQLHLGAAAVPVHARPLGEDHARLALPVPLPLRLGDRTVIRDPGTRSLWGAEVVDCGPPRLARRGAARERSAALQSWRGTVTDQVRARGLVERQHLERIGARPSELEPGSLAAGGWLLSPDRVREAGAALVSLVDGSDPEGIAVKAAARALQLPEQVVPALVEPPLLLDAGRVRRPRADALPAHLQRALETVRDDLATAPFAAPDAGRLRELGLGEREVVSLHRRGDLLHVGSSVVLLPDAPEEAVRRLATLAQPFTTSQARQALETSRRVVLPLLTHLDRTSRTVRLADDRRRLR